MAALGTELDDVTVAFRKERFPVEGDPAEKRAATNVTIWLLISVIDGPGTKPLTEYGVESDGTTVKNVSA